MFTGIVEEIGKVLNITNDTLSFSASKTVEDALIGSSICVNGVCLTLISLNKSSGTVNIGPETKKLSNIGELKLNDLVNLERPLSPQDRFGGHIVQGHIEGTCSILNIKKKNTNLQNKKIGDRINLETDIVARYIEKFLEK